MNRPIAFISLILLASCHPALAAEVAPAAASPWGDLARELILLTASTVIAAAIAIGVAQFTRWTGIQVEAKHREALHSAAMTGVALALSKYGSARPLEPGGQFRIVDDAMSWVLSTGAPAAVAGLNLREGDIRKLVESKVGVIAPFAASVTVSPEREAG